MKVGPIIFQRAPFPEWLRVHHSALGMVLHGSSDGVRFVCGRWFHRYGMERKVWFV